MGGSWGGEGGGVGHFFQLEHIDSVCRFFLFFDLRFMALSRIFQ